MQHRTRIAVFGSVLAAAAVGFTAPGAQAAAPEGISITNVTVNDGKPVVLGTTAGKTFKVSVTADTDSAITESDITLYGPNSSVAQPQTTPKCTAEGTKATCTGTFTIDPDVDFFDNTPAGTWYVNPLLVSDTDSIYAEKAGKFKLQREAKLTANAAPEPVKKGKTLTITGALTRANWETHKYAGYTGQSVTLEFKKKGATAYTAVKTVKTDNKGNLKTTVKASVDGSYRYAFAGNSSTGAVKAAGDAVDVR
ncbi:calcium-binding protein [Streptomyces sp. AN091965]|uniref:calcium-binding protein n=1 Tax=Streptomyces sp. AN091965 TaxID=2927803 RepID=UPI001F6251ED|nr:calcium-binding protein [Streptomyces sp. AN091965]MCI3928620.1 calcium-binding protein [Streptomyces sp. AN091965]